jgi:hypothetical protein
MWNFYQYSLSVFAGADIPQHILVAMIRPLELKAGSDGITVEHFMEHWITETSPWYVNSTALFSSSRKISAPNSDAATTTTENSDSSEWDGRQKVVKFAPPSSNTTTCYLPDSPDKARMHNRESHNAMHVDA